MTKGIMIFETPRLYARLLKLDDLEAMHEMQSDEEVMRYTSQRAAMTREETLTELTDLIIRYDQPGNDFWVWAVARREDIAFVGTCALIVNEAGEQEIGYRCLRKFWGNGYGMEMILGLNAYAFDELGLESLAAYVFSDNTASVRILEKAGYQLEKEFFNEEEQCMDKIYRIHRRT